jgi:F-type H+-transporting ATPase subunit a
MQTEVYSIIFISLLMIGYIMLTHNRLLKYEEGTKPKGLVVLAIAYVEAMLSITVPVMGKKRGRAMAAYVGTIFMYILLSNWAGLFGIKNPTANFSVTLALALITWMGIQYTKIRENGVKGYVMGFFEPFPFFVIPNIFSMFAPLISLSLRMFGNVLSGTIIMSMFYSFTSWLSGNIPLVGGFDFMGVVLAPWLHLYFDIFSGFLQAFLFISLTTIFIGIEYKEDLNNG